jgi:hypothetical protein
MVQVLVVLVDCWCATLSLFYINVTCMICFDLISSSSGKYFHVIAAMH